MYEKDSCPIRVLVRAHRNSSGIHTGAVALTGYQGSRRRCRRFPFVYNPDARTFVAYVVDDNKRELMLCRIAGDPLYQRIGCRDLAYPELQPLAEEVIYVLRAGFCAHLSVKYPDSILGKVAPLACRMAAQARQDKTQKRGTCWHMDVRHKLVESLIRLPSIRLTNAFSESLLQFCRSRQGAK